MALKSFTAERVCVHVCSKFLVVVSKWALCPAFAIKSKQRIFCSSALYLFTPQKQLQLSPTLLDMCLWAFTILFIGSK